MANYSYSASAHTIEDEKRTKPELDALNAEMWRVAEYLTGGKDPLA